MELVPGTVIAGRYRLERLLASGGMGAVWVAQHVTLGSELAIKFMHGDPTELTAARSRFEREARTASLIRHPNVVTVQDYGIEGQTPYMAMELLHGENLDDFLIRKKRITLDELEPIISQVSRGLRKAHETGIVHRDLKPSNVFIARDDGREIVKILDFGIAKEIDTQLGQHTKTTELMGSPHYMSPEQLRSTKKSDFRSDLWSLAVIIYKALTGVNPFPGDTLAEVMVQVFSGKWTPPSTLVPGLSATVDAFFQRAFARKPDDRFQSIHDMHNAFVAVVAGKPLPPPTPAASTPSAPSAAATSTPLPLTASSPAWPGVPIPPARPSVPSLSQIPPPVSGLSSPDSDPPKVPGTLGMLMSESDGNKVPLTLGIPPAPPLPAPNPGLSNPGITSDLQQKVPGTFGALGAFGAPPPPAPTSNPGLSPPSDPALAGPVLRGFGPPNASPAQPTALPWNDAPAPITSLPEDPRTEPAFPAPPEPPPIRPPIASTLVVPGAQLPGADLKRKRTILIGIVAALVVLVIGIVVVASSSTDSPDKPTPNAEKSSVPGTSPPASSEPIPEAAAAASGSALTPDEIAAAVPDETPVESVANDPPTPTPSATQTQKSNWKPIAKGQGRLLIKATGGVCKITINSTYYGVTPLDVMVDAGKLRVFCRTSTGSTRSKELRAAEYRLTMVEFNLKP